MEEIVIVESKRKYSVEWECVKDAGGVIAGFEGGWRPLIITVDCWAMKSLAQLH